MNNPQQWVQERRLRPIYELLDGGNNKKVIAEVDRLMKKQPNFTCAKVLKALALIRMNKTAEAQAILKPVATEIPTDDSTIQALSICYRELEEPQTLSSILEAACEKEKSEELLTHCFMAHVRMLEYNKMHRTAIQLYKLYNKPTYYGWAVASLVVRFEHEKPGPMIQADSLTIDYAGRMMEKFHSEQKTLDDNMMGLYLRVLAWQGKWKTLVEVMKGAGYPQRNWINDEFHMFYCEGLVRTQMFDELFDYLKTSFLNNKDEYGLLKQMIDTFAYRNIVNLMDLLNQLLETSPNRAVVLGYLYFNGVYIGGEKGVEKIEDKLPLAFKYGVDKPSFCSDVMLYFRTVSREAQLKIIGEIAPCSEPGVPNFDSITKIIRDVNFEQAFREYVAENDAELTRIRHANTCFGKYLICEEIIETLRTEDNLRTKESDYHDQYIIIAALSLMLEFYESPKLLEGWDLDSYLRSQPWTKLDNEDCHELRDLKQRLSKLNNKGKSNCKENENSIEESLQELHINEPGQAHLNDREALLTFAISVLEYGLARSPYNYSIRILLSRAYCRFGAVGQAIKVIQGLDLKHVQWDTLGYLIIPHALTSGAYSDAMKMMNIAETMYSSYRRESMEHVIAAYKYGSFHKVAEFVTFRNYLLGSIQYSQIFDEKRLMDLLMFTGSSADLKNLANKISNEIEWKYEQDERTADNRDFTVIEQFMKVPAAMFKEMASDSMHFMQLFRHALLYVISNIILRADEPSGMEFIKESIKKCEDYYKNCKKVVEDNFKDTGDMPQLYGIWPPRDHRYFVIPAASITLDLIRFITDALIEYERSNITALQKLIEDSSTTLLKHLQENYEAFCYDKRMLKIDIYIQDFHYVVEVFSFMRIVLIVMLIITRQQMKLKGKQKERTNQVLKKSMAAAIESLLNKSKELNERFNAFINELQARRTPRMDNMKTSLRDYIKESFLSVAFPSTFDVAQNNIRESQLNQLEEMRKLSTTHMEYIRNTLANEFK